MTSGSAGTITSRKKSFVTTRHESSAHTTQNPSQTKPSPLWYAAASVRRPVCPA